MKNSTPISIDAIEKIEYSRDNGSVPPAFYQKRHFVITPEQLVFTITNREQTVLSTKTIQLTAEQFTAICSQLAKQKINVPCHKATTNEPMPTGGSNSTVLMVAGQQSLEQTYYIGAGKVYGCGDVEAFGKFVSGFKG